MRSGRVTTRARAADAESLAEPASRVPTDFADGDPQEDTRRRGRSAADIENRSLARDFMEPPEGPTGRGGVTRGARPGFAGSGSASVRSLAWRLGAVE